MNRALRVILVGLTACGTEQGGPQEQVQEQDEVVEEVLEEVLGEQALAVTSAAPCSSAVVAQVLAQATSAAPEVKLTCSLTLTSSQTVSKRLVLEGAAASGVTIDCGGGSIGPSAFRGLANLHIRSVKKSDGTWSRPEGVTVRNCSVKGAVRISGMGNNGQGEEVRLSSLSPGHTARAQAAAPRAVLLEKLTLVGEGPIPLYLAPGVTETTLRDSNVTGVSGGTAIYFDAESARNTLRNNSIHAETDGREQLALDGSADNLVVGNFFAELSTGGIYLYRNCGEGGTVRHQPPRHNRIINNYFYYKNYTGSNPAIFVGSRNESGPSIFNYCGDDEPSGGGTYPFGSSRSNRDHADENLIAQNQIQSPQTVAKMIQVQGGPGNAALTYLPSGADVANVQVSARLTRAAGCPVEWGNGVGFVAFGAVADGQTCQGSTLWTKPRALELTRYYLAGVGHDASTKNAPHYGTSTYTKESSLGFLSSRPRSTGTWARAIVCVNNGDDTDRYVTLSGSCEEAGYIRDVLGFVPKTLPAPAPPLRDIRRCYLSAGRDHFLSTSANCEGQPVAENKLLFRLYQTAP